MTADTTQLTFYGYSTIVGKEVDIWLAGLDCGSAVVGTSGDVTVHFGADVDGLLTGAWLEAQPLDDSPYATSITFVYLSASVTVVVPVVIGFSFTTKGQCLRPNVESGDKTPDGPGLAKIRRNYMGGALLNGAIGVSFGTDFSHMREAVFYTDNGATKLDHSVMFSGVHWMDAMDDDPSFEGGIAWEVTRPYPCTVVGLTGFLEIEER